MIFILEEMNAKRIEVLCFVLLVVFWTLKHEDYVKVLGFYCFKFCELLVQCHGENCLSPQTLAESYKFLHYVTKRSDPTCGFRFYL